MRRINGIPLTSAVGATNEQEASAYIKDAIDSWEPNVRRLRVARRSERQHLTRRVNKPETTRAKYLIAQTTIAMGLAGTITPALIDSIPGSPIKTLLVAGAGSALGANGYAKSVTRWHKRKNKFSSQLDKAKKELRDSIASMGRENFTKAALAMELKELANGIENTRNPASFGYELQKFDDAVELVCDLAGKATTPQELEETLDGLDAAIDIVRDCLDNVRQDLEILEIVTDRTPSEAKYERNAKAFLPHAREAFAKLNASRNLASNIAIGIVSPTRADNGFGK